MADLVRCSTCGGKVSTNAEACPHCGERQFDPSAVSAAAGLPFRNDLCPEELSFGRKVSYVTGTAVFCAISSAIVFALSDAMPFPEASFGLASIEVGSALFVVWEVFTLRRVGGVFSRPASDRMKRLGLKFAYVVSAAAHGACFGGVIGTGHLLGAFFGVIGGSPTATMAVGGAVAGGIMGSLYYWNPLHRLWRKPGHQGSHESN